MQPKEVQRMADSSDSTRRGLPRHEWRELARLVLESLAAGMFASLVLALAVFIASAEAYAAVPGGSGNGQGTLMLQDARGNHVPAPLLFTDVHMSVSGMIARVQVKQLQAREALLMALDARRCSTSRSSITS